MDYLIIPAVVLAVLAAGYWLGRSHGRQAERDDAWLNSLPADGDLITPKGAGGPAGGGRRR